MSLPGNGAAEVIDLPGSYSLYPRRQDEWVSYKVLLNQDKELKADIIIAVADASNLKRNLLFCTQIIDLKQPVVIALTMMDLARRKGIKIDIPALERELGVPVVAVNPRKNKGITELKKTIALTSQQSYKTPARDFIDNRALAASSVDDVKQHLPQLSDYSAIHYLSNHESFALDWAMAEGLDNI